MHEYNAFRLFLELKIHLPCSITQTVTWSDIRILGNAFFFQSSLATIYSILFFFFFFLLIPFIWYHWNSPYQSHWVHFALFRPDSIKEYLSQSVRYFLHSCDVFLYSFYFIILKDLVCRLTTLRNSFYFLYFTFGLYSHFFLKNILCNYWFKKKHIFSLFSTFHIHVCSKFWKPVR